MDTVPQTAGPAYQRCTEFKVDGEHLYYSRLVVSPLGVGQANTLGIAMRRALLGELEGACITLVVFPPGINHECAAIAGVQESVHDILMNLKDIVLGGNPPVVQEAYISIAGPAKVTADDIVLSPFVRVVDPAQHIATVTKKIQLNIGLRIEKGCGYRRQNMVEHRKGDFSLDAVSMPVRNVNYSIHCYENHSGGMTKEMLLLEIWTDGSITPKGAIRKASRNLINLFSSFAMELFSEGVCT
uniref:RNA polymerase subunit alpha n=1 Tax=Selaginella lepidophylla TaxID=59777 RepID=A0A3Q9R471_SELLP|nr:RNA polymerase subunit alpha [Selaginella lepidophylla]AZU95853.1 RNA polymerase subunit alpha [Selaginella lepidophylla]